VFATLASVTLGLSVYDTQCGAKLFRCNDATRALFAEPFGSRWVFDVELLARYLTQGGAPSAIRELPLARWTDVAGSKVKPYDFARGLVELLRIKRKYGLRRSD
jgi:dolichyl-phosphate beta-glucosyltransferase